MQVGMCVSNLQHPWLYVCLLYLCSCALWRLHFSWQTVGMTCSPFAFFVSSGSALANVIVGIRAFDIASEPIMRAKSKTLLQGVLEKEPRLVEPRLNPGHTTIPK